MEFRRLGRTDESIPTIGMGTWRIGVYSNSSERERQVKALRKGLELGCNLIDTAEMYANGRSEEVVAEAVGTERSKVFIATKVSPGNLRHDDVLAACSRSLKRLGTSYIDLYQVHWPNPKVPIRETMTAMEELVRNGMIRYIGVSNFSVKQATDARAELPKSELVSNQVEYSILNRGVENEILPYCKREKITLIAYTPLARGNVPSSMIPQSVCQKYNLTPIQAMLNWVTRSESVVAIPKSATRSISPRMLHRSQFASPKRNIDSSGALKPASWNLPARYLFVASSIHYSYIVYRRNLNSETWGFIFKCRVSWWRNAFGATGFSTPRTAWSCHIRPALAA